MAATVISLAYKDLHSKSVQHRHSARLFFEDPIIFCLFCDLAEIDSTVAYKGYLDRIGG